jgi:hypothetical protein
MPTISSLIEAKRGTYWSTLTDLQRMAQSQGFSPALSTIHGWLFDEAKLPRGRSLRAARAILSELDYDDSVIEVAISGTANHHSFKKAHQSELVPGHQSKWNILRAIDELTATALADHRAPATHLLEHETSIALATVAMQNYARRVLSHFMGASESVLEMRAEKCLRRLVTRADLHYKDQFQRLLELAVQDRVKPADILWVFSRARPLT